MPHIRMRFFFSFLFFDSAFIGLVVGQSAAVNLKRDLFSKYDSNSRPLKNSSHQIKVCAGLYVLQIVGLSEKSQVRVLHISTRIGRKFFNF
jgi:hypothetical protein